MSDANDNEFKAVEMKSTKEEESKKVKKNWFTLSNIFNGVLIIFVIAMLVNPNVKAFVIQGLMKVGLFQPSVSGNRESVNPELYSQVTFLDGNQTPVRLADLKGKVVFLNFWATWCPPCIAEMPSIQTLSQQYNTSDEVVFLMVDADGKYERSKAFMEKNHYDLPVFIPANNIPQELFEGSLPTTIILDKKSRIVFKHEGSSDYSNPKISKLIDQLINE